MNVSEGAKRMRQAGRWIAIISLAVCLLAVVAVFVLGIQNLLVGFGVCINLFIPIAIAGVILWIAGWIVEGFAKETP